MLKYRTYKVGDLIQIFGIPHIISRVDKTHIASRDNYTKTGGLDLLSIWSWDEVEDIPINEDWVKVFNIDVYDTVQKNNHDLYYDRETESLHCNGMSFRDKTFREFQNSFYDVFSILPTIEINHEK